MTGDQSAQQPASGGTATAVGGIEVASVRRAFGSVLAVDDISLTARPGEVTALVGPNGAGKTTLLLMLATLLVPDHGTIRIDGFDPVTQPGEVRARIGRMPDGFGTWDALTVREVLHTIAAAYRMGPVEARARTEAILELLHLGDLADRRARVLSRGQKQRLGLARALIHDPSVLLLDEPATTVGSWRITSLDPDRLRSWLHDQHGPWRAELAAVEVEVGGDEQAARLLADLVADGIRITAFAPSQGALEAAYLAATEDRQ